MTWLSWPLVLSGSVTVVATVIHMHRHRATQAWSPTQAGLLVLGLVVALNWPLSKLLLQL